VNLGHVLSGETSWGGEEYDESGIDLLPLPVPDGAPEKGAGGNTGGIHTGHTECDRKRIRTGESQEGDGAGAGGGYGGDDRRSVAFACFPPSFRASPGPGFVHGFLLGGGGYAYARAACSAAICRF